MNTLALPRYTAPRSIGLLVAFLVVVIGVGGLIGFANVPGPWYMSLAKPPFNPPNWLFAPVWFILYVLIAIAGWRTFLAEPRGIRTGIWAVQMLLNWAWSPTFFGLRQLWPALAIILLMLAAIFGFIVVSWQKDRVSAGLFVPYALWVGFATLLNASIALLN